MDNLSRLYPSNSQYKQSDWEMLAGYWHPVAFSAEVGEDRPFGAVLLDLPVALYRVAGKLTAVVDRCPHRGTRLSLGRVIHERLICPYHGLEFDQGGVCTRVPAHGDAHGDGAHYLDLTVFPALERFGIVWISLSSQPMGAIPDWSATEDSNRQRVQLDTVWNASAGRHLENFCDMAHFAFAHEGTFGVTAAPRVPDYSVIETQHGFTFTAEMPLRYTGSEDRIELVKSEYEVALPFAVRLSVHNSRGLDHICDAAMPISLGRIRIFQVISRTHPAALDPRAEVAAQVAVNEEDRRMVESQQPLGLPLQPRLERHIGSDRFSVIYRKWWARRGLEGPI
jgi:phenylpropionate dioxygenase-like ring-hydroxylating dioxygenase large terminal subunit